MKRLFPIVLLVVLTGCKDPGETVTTEGGISETVLIAVRDSIGVSNGDSNYVFGEITAVREGSRGEILVLDRIRSHIAVYDSEGIFVKNLSRAGQGPGELQNPVDFSIDDAGNIQILDFFKGSLIKLSSRGEYVSTLETYMNMPPNNFRISSESLYVSLRVEELVSEGGSLQLKAYLGYSFFDSDESIILWQKISPFDIERIQDIYYNTILSIVYDVDSHGNVYLAPSSTEIYNLESYDPRGNRRFEISHEVTPVLKSEEYSNEEEEYVKFLATSFGGHIDRDFDVPPYRNVVSDIDVDINDRIWVRQGLSELPVFDIYSSEGEYLLTVEIQIPEQLSNYLWKFEIDRTVIGYPLNPVDYHRLCIFDSTDSLFATR